MIDRAKKSKIKNFLKTNLETLTGDQLSEFMERYDIKEAGAGEVMLLDHGMPGKFVAFKKPDSNSYWITTYEMMEKILFIGTLDPDSDILKENAPIRIN